MGAHLDVVAEARSWLGTPWHHQAALKGVGCDCAGLVRGVGNALGLIDVRLDVPEAAAFRGYARKPNPRLMVKALNRFLLRVANVEARPGDVLLFRMAEPQHLAILTEDETIIHALCRAGRVVEARLDPSWRQGLAGVWRYPGL